MAEALTAKKTAIAGGVLVRLSGTLDADLDPHALTDGLTGGVVVFDMDGVKRTTSFGVREWVAAMQALKGASVYFARVRPSVVAQLNVVERFGGGGALVSFYLPYFCDDCDQEVEVLLDLRKTGVPTSAPDVACPKCGKPADFDDDPVGYFSYAKKKPLSIVPVAAQLLDAIDPVAAGAAQKLQAQKEVVGDVTGIWLQGYVTATARFGRLLEGLEGQAVVVMHGVLGADAGGIARLAELGATAGAVSCARVPAALVSPLANALAGRAQIVSVSLPCECPRCGSVTLELSSADVDRSIAGGQLRCPRCRAEIPSAGPFAQLELVRPYLAPTLPRVVKEYLASCVGRGALGLRFEDSDKSGDIAHAPVALEGYSAVKELGRGGMAVVYLAKKNGPEGFVKRVALKVILDDLAQRKSFVDMFFAEAKLAATVNHPNVVQIFDLGREGETHFIAMEYVDGWDLRALIRTATREKMNMPVDVVCRIGADVCAGLQAAHTAKDDRGNALNIVHRDVSPHNILVSLAGDVKITDFGVSKANISRPGTVGGALKGKVGYLAPEQIDKKLGNIDARTDVFGAGVVIYEMLTGASPFKRDKEIDSIRASAAATVIPIERIRPDVPDELAEVVHRALQKSQDARFSTAQDLRSALEGVLVRLGKVTTSAEVSAWAHQVFGLGLPVIEPVLSAGTATTLMVDMTPAGEVLSGPAHSGDPARAGAPAAVTLPDAAATKGGRPR